MLTNPPEIWLGSDASLANHLQRHEQEPPARLYQEDDDKDIFEEMAESILERYESVGLVNIKGTLVNDESPISMWFGDLGYQTVQRAINQLLEDESVSSIVLNLDTPGGDAQGVEELGEFIKAASTVKPITAWASTALSAGYWIAASADKVYTSKMGQTGSIGAIATVMSYYERLRESGVEPFVARSAPRKAIPHPAEPLSEAGKKSVQDRVNAYGNFFVENVARNRPTLSYANAKSTWATGETFFGEQALNLGLVDGIKQSISQLIGEQIQVHNQQITPGAPTMAKKLILTDLEAARVSMGLDPETAAPIEPQLAADPEPKTEPTPEPVAASEPAAPSQDGLATYLKEEIATLKQENATLKAELQTQAQLKTDLNAHQAQVAHLRPVAEAAVTRLAIGLGHRPMALESLPADLLAKTFTDLQAELMALPAGRMSAEPSTDVIEGDQPETLMQHRLRLVPQARA
jgi:signal peptide peptidase SppA